MLSVTLLTPAELVRAVGARAKDRRLALGLGQAELSERAAVPLSSLRRFERTGRIGLEALARLALALDAGEGVAALFPAPDLRRLEDVLAPPPRRRAPRRSRA